MSMDTDKGHKKGAARVADIVTAWDIMVSGPVEEIYHETVFRLSSARGDDLILKKIGGIDAHVLQQVDLEVQVLLHVQHVGLPVAVPLPDKRGRIAVPWGEYYYSLSPCLPQTDRELAPPDRDRLFRNYGRTIARMHRALATFPHHQFGDQIGQTDLVSEVFDIGLPIILRYLAGDQAGTFRAMMADLEADMRHALPHLPEQLIHRDCHAENLLSSGTEVTGIIDWDHLIIGPRVLDVAYFAVQLAKRNVHDPAEMAQWLHDFPLLLEGYESECELLEGEKTAFPYVLISVPVFFAYWAIETSHDDGYIQTELDTVTWLHGNLDVIQESMQVV